VTSDPDFKVTFFEVEYRKKRRILKTKLITIAQLEKYLTYGMVLCLVNNWLTSECVARVCQHQLSFFVSIGSQRTDGYPTMWENHSVESGVPPKSRFGDQGGWHLGPTPYRPTLSALAGREDWQYSDVQHSSLHLMNITPFDWSEKAITRTWF